MKWYSIVHFDTPEHLNQWVKSRDRESMISTGSKVFSSYRFMSFATGLEGWFSQRQGGEQMGLGPPAWKQNLSVVLGLYPVVMMQSLLFGALGIMQEWSLPSSMIVNNLITSSILTWLVMPLVSQVFGFWLYPASQPTVQKKDWLGTLAIAGALVLMVLLFNALVGVIG
jgi:antibiotic biosynthesis monooxygenase (ABM) superfamily enzyme